MARTITVYGRGFAGTGYEHGPSCVHLGPQNGPTNVDNIVLVSPYELRCDLPDRQHDWPAAVALWITTPFGVGVLPAAYTYQEPAVLAVTSVAPSSAPGTAPTAVSIGGTALGAVVMVEVLVLDTTVHLRDVVAVSDTEVTATMPSGFPGGPYALRVTTALSYATLAAAWTWT